MDAGLRYTAGMLRHGGEAMPPSIDWNQVDDVLLDMDGTLLDRHFDNFFFRGRIAAAVCGEAWPDI